MIPDCQDGQHKPSEDPGDVCEICNALICPDNLKKVVYSPNPQAGLPEYFHMDGTTCFLHQVAVRVEEPEDPADFLAKEVYLALHREAPNNWISDYVEYFTEMRQPSGDQPAFTPSFESYLRFQVEVEQEEEIEATLYLRDLNRYLERFHPTPDLPPRRLVTVELIIPGDHDSVDAEDFIRQNTIFPDGVEVQSVIEETE